MAMRTLLLAAMMFPATVLAQAEGGVGYPTVAAALEALKARNDVSISAQGGWTIVEEKGASTIWSFTPADHAAHPAVVRRQLVQENGGVNMKMTALCQASKAACDKLMEEFQAMNARMAESLSPKWQASSEQKERVEALSRKYFSLKQGGQYQEAYAMLSAAQQQQMSFARWSLLAQDFNARAGQPISLDIKKVTWYHNPPQAAPGTYAAVDFSGAHANTSLYCGYIVLSEQADGSFLIMREEQNVIDKETASKLKPGETDAIRLQFKCK
ncbi:DUF4019 domain-containing protein [Duganella sp. FT135W]|uniref:DUF4019 domain-containing protein n=1 Tax=Duganella flavida TaxID=2692175 RepID=A0A6L8KHG3_9BURK|nr:DUF4019 domain-containing protein [Duganella flavida]MYM23951.1 DUF4019 domain-containing protein [Duganella flavida]